MRSIQQTPGLALQIADSVLQKGGDGAAGLDDSMIGQGGRLSELDFPTPNLIGA
jgi:hypothetical protein